MFIKTLLERGDGFNLSQSRLNRFSAPVRTALLAEPRC
jgi:hypothetical protein